jgi:hypothetical protein
MTPSWSQYDLVLLIYTNFLLIQVEDGTSSALLICQDSTQLKKIFDLKPEEWLELEQESKCRGELLYLYSGEQFKSTQSKLRKLDLY